MSYQYTEESLQQSSVLPKGVTTGQRLTNQIHPLFAQNNFEMSPTFEAQIMRQPYVTDDDISQNREWMSDELYDRIRPALQLASHFIEVSLNFIELIAFAPTDDIKEQGRNFGPISPLQIRGKTMKQKTKRLLEDLATILIIRMSPVAELKGNHGSTAGCYRKGALMYRPYIDMGEYFKDFFGQPSYQKASKACRDSVLFGMAITLVHELMHCVFFYRFRDSVKKDAIPDLTDLHYRHVWEEVRLLEGNMEYFDEKVEFGLEWEHFMFGGFVHEITFRQMLDMEHGHRWTRSKSYAATQYCDLVMDEEPDFAISFDSISRMFLDETWKNRLPVIVLRPERANLPSIDNWWIGVEYRWVVKAFSSPYNVTWKDVLDLRSSLEQHMQIEPAFWMGTHSTLFELTTISKAFHNGRAEEFRELMAFSGWRNDRFGRGQPVPWDPVEAFKWFREAQNGEQ